MSQASIRMPYPMAVCKYYTEGPVYVQIIHEYQ